MFDEIKRRVADLKKQASAYFPKGSPIFEEIPDSHSVAIVCSHQGIPLYALKPGKYKVHNTEPQVNLGPLNRYKKAVASIIKKI